MKNIFLKVSLIYFFSFFIFGTLQGKIENKPGQKVQQKFDKKNKKYLGFLEGMYSYMPSFSSFCSYMPSFSSLSSSNASNENRSSQLDDKNKEHQAQLQHKDNKSKLELRDKKKSNRFSFKKRNHKLVIKKKYRPKFWIKNKKKLKKDHQDKRFFSIKNVLILLLTLCFISFCVEIFFVSCSKRIKKKNKEKNNKT